MSAVFIHLDNSATWGNGTSLNGSDSPQKRNINIKWESQSGNVYNSTTGGAQITYSADDGIFITPKPVRLVMSQGDTSYLNLSSLNASLTTQSITKAVVNNSKLDGSNGKSFLCMVGWLDEIPKKTDGTPAANDSESSYYEICLLAKELKFPFSAFGIDYTFSSKSNITNSGGAYIMLGGYAVLNNTGAFQSGRVDGLRKSWDDESIWKYNFTDLNSSNIFGTGSIVPWEPGNNTYINGGQELRYLVNSNSINILNKGNGDLVSYQINISNGEFIAPLLSLGSNFISVIDDLKIIGFDDIIT